MPLRRELRSIAVGVVSQDQENVIPPRGLPPPLPNPPVGATQAPPALAGLMRVADTAYGKGQSKRLCDRSYRPKTKRGSNS
ncbi:hypothetical protein V6N13_109808 [Hibiscus sabdariffa]